MPVSQEAILQQNEKDKEFFSSLSAAVREALDIQAEIALGLTCERHPDYQIHRVSTFTRTRAN